MNITEILARLKSIRMPIRGYGQNIFMKVELPLDTLIADLEESLKAQPKEETSPHWPPTQEEFDEIAWKLGIPKAQKTEPKPSSDPQPISHADFMEAWMKVDEPKNLVLVLALRVKQLEARLEALSK